MRLRSTRTEVRPGSTRRSCLRPWTGRDQFLRMRSSACRCTNRGVSRIAGWDRCNERPRSTNAGRLPRKRSSERHRFAQHPRSGVPCTTARRWPSTGRYCNRRGRRSDRREDSSTRPIACTARRSVCPWRGSHHRRRTVSPPTHSHGGRERRPGVQERRATASHGSSRCEMLVTRNSGASRTGSIGDRLTAEAPCWSMTS